MRCERRVGKEKCFIKAPRLKKQPPSALKNGFPLFIPIREQAEATKKESFSFYCFFIFYFEPILIKQGKECTNLAEGEVGKMKFILQEANQKVFHSQKISFKAFLLICCVKWNEKHFFCLLCNNGSKNIHFFHSAVNLLGCILRPRATITCNRNKK